MPGSLEVCTIYQRAYLPQPSTLLTKAVRMKIRWTEESVRFRITPTELDALRRGQEIRARMPLPGGWTAAIYVVETTALTVEAGELRLLLSGAEVTRLLAPEAEGVYFQQAESGLRYYIEKDFPCEHPRASEARETAETFDRIISTE